jgi:hypothetical protein
MISVTLPAKYQCDDCGDLFIDPETDYERRGKYYYVRDACPACYSTNVDYLGTPSDWPPRRKGIRKLQADAF